MNRLPRINAVLKFGQRACRLVPTGTVPARIVLVLTPKRIWSRGDYFFWGRTASSFVSNPQSGW